MYCHFYNFAYFLYSLLYFVPFIIIVDMMFFIVYRGIQECNQDIHRAVDTPSRAPRDAREAAPRADSKPYPARPGHPGTSGAPAQRLGKLGSHTFDRC